MQNSLDATASESVRVRFALHEPNESGSSELAKRFNIDQLAKRLSACSINPESINLAKPKLLVIEDFGTTGLTGSWNSVDDNPFCDFWRRMGKSHKGEKSLGRWGLGKLVFSSSSKARIFFGLTVRQSDPTSLLMGQAVLTNHVLDNTRFDSHGFFCKVGKDQIQLPIIEKEDIDSFKSVCGINRSDRDAGLSIVVPYILDTITEQRIIQAVLKNYFFPILLGRLIVTVGKVEINADSFAALAKASGGDRFSSGGLAKFIASLRAVRKGEIEPISLPTTWLKTGMAVALGDHTIELRDKYQKGECICVRAPLLLKQKDGAELMTSFDLLLQKADGDSETLFIRDTIVLPAESKYFRGHNAMAALVAEDKSICSFLGDAENPAHTSWSASAEKVTTGWRNPSSTLKNVRGALQQLYSEIVSSIEIADPNALIDFFSAKAEAGTQSTRPRGPVVRPTNPRPPEPKEKAYRLVRLKGGFSIRGNQVLTAEQLPLSIRVRVAYDVLRGNPFSKHDALDFDFAKKDEDVKISATAASVNAHSANVLFIKAHKQDFEVSVNGFDVRRDLIIDAARY